VRSKAAVSVESLRSSRVKVESVSKHYTAHGKRIDVLSDISFSVEDNEFACIIGPSGCGKTVLLNMLGGFEKPSSGNITIGGIQVEQPDRNYMTIFQDYKLLPWRTVRKNIELGLEGYNKKGTGRKFTKKEIDDIVTAQIESVGLTGFEDYRPAEISGGMKQRVAIARALAVEPDVLFMDEPFGALDSITKESMQLKLRQLLDVKGKTVVFVTHDIDEAISMADKLIIMQNNPGTIISVMDIKLPEDRNRYNREFRNVRDTVFELMHHI
jgi:NitT/TauT family transport system ATP-binding protein